MQVKSIAKCVYLCVAVLGNILKRTWKALMGKFKKNATIQFFYPHVLNMEYFYLNLSLKCVFWYPFICCQIWNESNDK